MHQSQITFCLLAVSSYFLDFVGEYRALTTVLRLGHRFASRSFVQDHKCGRDRLKADG